MVDKDTQRNYSIEMNIFKELKKAPKVTINEVSYGAEKQNSDKMFAYLRRNPHYSYEGKTAVQWAKELGLSGGVVRDRIKRYGDPYFVKGRNVPLLSGRKPLHTPWGEFDGISEAIVSPNRLLKDRGTIMDKCNDPNVEEYYYL